MKLETPLALSTLLIFIIGVMLFKDQIMTHYPSIKNEPPLALKKEYVHENFGEKRIDYYHWLKDTKLDANKPSIIIDHLKTENEYADKHLYIQKDLETKIFDELKGRVKLADKTVPVKHDNYLYYSRIEDDQNYYIHARTKTYSPDLEEIILDENEIATEDFFSLGTFAVSHDHKLLAYSTDNVGNERYTLFIKNLDSHNLLEDKIENVVGDVIWLKDNSGFLYLTVDETWRPYKVFYHQIGNPDDKLIYHEQDEKFRVSIREASNNEYLFVSSESSAITESYIMKSNRAFEFSKFIGREEGLLYSLDAGIGWFYALINDKGKNFRLIKFSSADAKKDQYIEVVPHNKDIYLRNLAVYEKNLVLETVVNGLTFIEVQDMFTEEWKTIPLKQDSYAANIDYTTIDDVGVRFNYSSLNTPNSVMLYKFETEEIQTLKTQEIPSGHVPDDYVVERHFAESTGGVKVPISLVYKKSLFKRDGSNPLYLYAYGSYGYGIEPAFNRNALSLVDRGFVYAIAHIRGGDDLGFEWYEQAKFLNKHLTFDDFINSALYLIKFKYAKEQNIVAMGGSAGGMLMGVVINRRPDLFKTVVAHVPFVDVLNTMLDDTLPLTTNEYLEWGNPNEKPFYDYLKSYSPYENVKKQDYPNLYVTTSLGDTRVAYWEPAKWVAKLREYNNSNNLILFETNLHAGHGGASGRFGYLKDKAREYTFILTTLKINN
ncbi:MAG: S9 family peptidase [Sphingobacteriia bacterium]|nr:S9 family peptidase [Sphingobacteriia bacterium]